MFSKCPMPSTSELCSAGRRRYTYLACLQPSGQKQTHTALNHWSHMELYSGWQNLRRSVGFSLKQDLKNHALILGATRYKLRPMESNMAWVWWQPPRQAAELETKKHLETHQISSLSPVLDSWTWHDLTSVLVSGFPVLWLKNWLLFRERAEKATGRMASRDLNWTQYPKCHNDGHVPDFTRSGLSTGSTPTKWLALTLLQLVSTGFPLVVKKSCPKNLEDLVRDNRRKNSPLQMLLRQAKQCHVTAKGRTWAKNPSPVANRHPVVWIVKSQKTQRTTGNTSKWSKG